MFTIPYTVTTICPFCGMPHDVEVDFLDFCAWQNGELAQRAFPYLSADEREMLISGICPDCWERTFGSDEEPDPDDHPIQQGILGVLDDYAAECMEHMDDADDDYWDDGCPIEDSDQPVEVYEGSAEDIFHLLFGEEAQW